MEPILYVMAIMGCGDGQQICSEARVEPAQYTSIQACQEAMPAALVRNADIDFPVVTATCRSTGMRMVKAGRTASNNG